MPYLIGLAARTFDPDGALTVPWRDGSETGSVTRRVSRTPTLDGGAAISNRGYSAADRTVTVSLEGQSWAMVERVRRLLRLHSQLTVSLRDGAYFGVPSEYNEGRQALTILISGEA